MAALFLLGVAVGLGIGFAITMGIMLYIIHGFWTIKGKENLKTVHRALTVYRNYIRHVNEVMPPRFGARPHEPRLDRINTLMRGMEKAAPMLIDEDAKPGDVFVKDFVPSGKEPNE